MFESNLTKTLLIDLPGTTSNCIDQWSTIWFSESSFTSHETFWMELLNVEHFRLSNTIVICSWNSTKKCHWMLEILYMKPRKYGIPQQISLQWKAVQRIVKSAALQNTFTARESEWLTASHRTFTMISNWKFCIFTVEWFSVSQWNIISQSF